MTHHSRDENLGLWLGVLGVTFFAMTVPMTRLATGSAEAPQLSPWFVTFGRAVLAGCLSLIFLALTRSPKPQTQHLKALGVAALGNAIGYPLFLGLALRHVTASHAAVITATLPLVTAAVAAWVMHQRAGRGFWACAVLGSMLVLVFSVHWTLARRAARMNPSVIREILKVTERPGIISFAGGLPSSKTFPVSEFTAACTQVLTTEPQAALQYAASEGFAPLRQMVADRCPGMWTRPGADHHRLTAGSGPDRQDIDRRRQPRAGGNAHLPGRPAGFYAHGARGGQRGSDDEGVDIADLTPKQEMAPTRRASSTCCPTSRTPPAAP
jgi:hypothetical protein